MPCGGLLVWWLPGVPLVHGLEVLFVTVENKMGAFVLVVEAVVGEDASKLKDAIGERVQTAHLEVYPKKVGNEIDTHHSNNYIKCRPACNNILSRLSLSPHCFRDVPFLIDC